MPWMRESASGPSPRLSRAVRLEGGRRRDTQLEGRRGHHPGCTTVLSRYNPSVTCSEHDGWRDAPGKRQRG
jgi:hypothetical protein